MSGILDIAGYYDPTTVGKIVFGPAPLLTAAPQVPIEALTATRTEVVCNALPPQKWLYIRADSNDGDYLGELKLLDPAHESLITRWADFLKARGGNWSTRWEYDDGELACQLYANDFTEDEFDILNGYIPHGDYGIHTVVKVQVLHTYNTERLL